MSIQTETLKSVDRVLRLDDGGNGVAVLNGAHVTGATTVTVVSGGANFAAGEPFRVGDGDRMTVYTVLSSTGTTVVIASPGLRRDYNDGEAVQEMVASIHGPVSDTGTKPTVSRDSSDVFVGSQRLPFGLIQGYGKVGAEFTLAALTMHALAFGLGMPMASVLGANTANDPYQIASSGSDFGSATNVAIVIEATRQDLTRVRFELYGANFDYTGISLKLARGTASQVPVKLIAASALVDFAATAFNVTGTDYSVASTDLLDGLTEFGYLSDATTGALSTTLSGSSAVGVNTFALTAATNLVAGDWIRVGSGSTAEYHEVRTAGTSCVTYTRTLRGFASGAVVVRQVRNPLGTLSADGFTMQSGGSVSELKVGTEDMVAGLRAGNAFVEFKWALSAFSSTTFALALGLAVPAAGTALFVRSGIGNTTVGALYAYGLTQGAKRLTVVGWTCRAIVNADVPMNTTGDAPAIPGSHKPTSGFQIFAR